MKYIFFYAPPRDIVPALARFEANAPLKFVQIDILSSPNRSIYLNSSEIPNAGVAERPSGVACPTYIVSHRDTKNQLHSIQSNDGRKLWAVRNGDNDETVLLTLAGVWQKDMLIEGKMTTLHTTVVAQQLMRWFVSALKQEGFMKLERCWVGREAAAMLKAGKRLTQAEQAPLDCDLRWPDRRP